MKHKTNCFLLIAATFALSACSILPSAMNHNSKTELIFPYAIGIVDVNDAAMVTKDVVDYQTKEILYDYYFTVKKADSSYQFYLKAVVAPDNCSYPDVDVIKDEQDAKFDIFTSKEDSSLSKNTFIIKPSSPLAQGATLLAPFYVWSTNPGEKISIKVCVSFYRNAYN